MRADVSFLIDNSTERRCSATGSSVFCHIERLEPRQAFAGAILARPRTPGPVVAVLTASSASRDSDPASDEASVRTRVRECWISGTDFNDRLRGTRRAERICGHGGADVIEALAGADVVQGGWQADTLVGGAGRDRLIGGRGDDVIHARDGERDTIECGWGNDHAVVDRTDRVLRGCERVDRT